MRQRITVYMKKLFPVILLLLCPLVLNAERPPVSIDGSVLASSAFLWRGDKLCGAHLNPNIEFHAGGFTLGSYSFIALNGKYKEIDWDISYALGDFSIHLSDYYSRASDDPMQENYFSWSKGATNHMDEISLMYESSVIPLNVRWFTFFWGDWIPDENADPGKLSSFLELETYYESEKYGTATLNLGISVFRGYYTDYEKPFMPVHIGLSYEKSFDLGKVEIPLGASIVFNPWMKACHAAAYVGLAF